MKGFLALDICLSRPLSQSSYAQGSMLAIWTNNQPVIKRNFHFDALCDGYNPLILIFPTPV
ncbi:hypothetical protein HH1059_08870 [Halorhodospira halochloris]|uniref:Uncharacterized protein n=1 Tax=Halorhodospira halochloris TaxID=1052 RepID=A0A2Z6EZJ3_HALHR|nr:hypothetical protein HH1059_08870 [Halorhodospira halochloris]